ncbi:hypothetical protein Tco_0426071, partial [Tanacetum coccineum]
MEQFKIDQLEANLERFKIDQAAINSEAAKQWAFLQATIEKHKVEADWQFAEIMNALEALQPPTTLPATIPHFEENSRQSFSDKEKTFAHVSGFWNQRIAKTARTRLGQGISHVYERRMCLPMGQENDTWVDRLLELIIGPHCDPGRGEDRVTWNPGINYHPPERKWNFCLNSFIESNIMNNHVFQHFRPDDRHERRAVKRRVWDPGITGGYSTNSKAFRVFNSKTRIVEENMHVKFSEETPNIAGNRPNWLFDIDALTKSMNYESVVTGNQSNGSADPSFSSSLKVSPDVGFKPSMEEEKKDVEDPENEDSVVPNTKEPRVNQEQDENVNNTNNINTISSTVNDVGIKDNVADKNIIPDELFFGRSLLSSYGRNEQKDDGIFISQDKYVDEILKKFGFSTIKTASTPIETSKRLMKDENAEDVDVHLYRSMIGSLMYLTSSRLDIMFVVCACARFQVTSKVSYLHVVKRIFRYLKGQPKLGLWYPKDSPFDLEAYTGSDYAGESLDRKSTTGGCQFLRSRLISWQCKKQTVVANSTTETEYVVASSCCRQVTVKVTTAE